MFYVFVLKVFFIKLNNHNGKPPLPNKNISNGSTWLTTELSLFSSLYTMNKFYHLVHVPGWFIEHIHKL